MTKERAPFDTCNKKNTIENHCELITAAPINVHVSLDMSLDEIAEKYEKILKSNRKDQMQVFFQDLVTYFKKKEIPVLKNLPTPVIEREITFTKIMRAYRVAGRCYTYLKRNTAEIEISKHILLPGNGKAIIDVIAHEVLHGLLPHKECHKNGFKIGMFKINKALGTHIRITGVNGKFETPKDSPTPWLYELYCPKCGKVITKYKSLCKSVRTAKNYYHNPCRVSLKARKIKK